MVDFGDAETRVMRPLLSKEQKTTRGVLVEVDPKFREFQPLFSSCLEAVPDSVLNAGYLKKITAGTAVANKAKGGRSAAYWDDGNAESEAIEGLGAGTITVPNKYIDITRAEKHKVKIGLTDEVDGGILTLEELPSVIMHEIGHAAYFYFRDNHPEVLNKLLVARKKLLDLQNGYMDEELEEKQHLSFEDAVTTVHTKPLPFVYYSPNARLIGDWQRLFKSYVDKNKQDIYEFVPEIFCDYILERSQMVKFANRLPENQREIYLGENGIVTLLDTLPSFQLPKRAVLEKIQSDLNRARSLNKLLLVNSILDDPDNELLQERFKKEFGLDFKADQESTKESQVKKERNEGIKTGHAIVTLGDAITGLVAYSKFLIRSRKGDYEIPRELLDDLRAEVSKPLLSREELNILAKVVETQLKIDFPKLDYQALGPSETWAEKVFFTEKGFLKELWFALSAEIRLADEKLLVSDGPFINSIRNHPNDGITDGTSGCIFVNSSLKKDYAGYTVAHEFVETALQRGTKRGFLSNIRQRHGRMLSADDIIYDLHERGINYYMTRALRTNPELNASLYIDPYVKLDSEDIIVWDMLIKRVGEARLKAWLVPSYEYERRFSKDEKEKPILEEYKAVIDEFKNKVAYSSSEQLLMNVRDIIDHW